MLSRALTQTFVFDIEKPAIALDDRQLPGGIHLTFSDEQLEAELPTGVPLDKVFEFLNAENIQVNSMRTKSNRLETFFLQLVDQN